VLKVFDAPDCIVEAMRHRDLREPDYMIYGAGRALGFMRMAAWALQEVEKEIFGGDQRAAEYHAAERIGRTAPLRRRCSASGFDECCADSPGRCA